MLKQFVERSVNAAIDVEYLKSTSIIFSVSSFVCARISENVCRVSVSWDPQCSYVGLLTSRLNPLSRARNRSRVC